MQIFKIQVVSIIRENTLIIVEFADLQARIFLQQQILASGSAWMVRVLQEVYSSNFCF